jgi:adenylosuccinate synthase
MTNLTVVVGAQFGSEGKGAIVGHLARSFGVHDCVIRVAGPNAGHTAYDDAGREWKLRAVPVGAVTNPHCELHIAAGSEVDLDVLASELNELDAAGHRATERLTVHPSATILTSEHRATEGAAGLIGRIGSTGKGIGAARADRIMRRAITFEELVGKGEGSLGEWWTDTHSNLGSRWEELLGTDRIFPAGKYDNIIIDGTQ